jgi:hypothetical protein
MLIRDFCGGANATSESDSSSGRQQSLKVNGAVWLRAFVVTEALEAETMASTTSVRELHG